MGRSNIWRDFFKIDERHQATYTIKPMNPMMDTYR
jgi:hypothetical protein